MTWWLRALGVTGKAVWKASMSAPPLPRPGRVNRGAADEPLNARRGFWMLNPYNWDAGWHVCIDDGLGDPSPGDEVIVTRRDGSKTVQRVASVEVAMARVGVEDDTYYLVKP